MHRERLMGVLMLMWGAVARTDPAVVTVRVGDRDIDVRTIITGGPVQRRRSTTTYPTHIEITDTFENPTETVVGMHVRHAIAADDHAVLGGRSDASVTDLYDPWNPTLFVPTSATTGVGLVAEDDVFRNQLHLARDTATAALRTDLLCVGPHVTYQMTWSVYPKESDYWDFINTVRRDWHVNDTTIPGAMIWFRPDDILARPLAALRDALAAQNVAVASLSGGWVDPRATDSPPRIGFGTHVMDPPFAAYRTRLRTAIAALHAARPGLRVLLYFDAQRESASDAPERFADSLLLGPRGRPERSDFGQRFSPSWSMVPTIGNHFGRALPAVAAAFRELGADGLYWDEMDAVEYSAPRITAATWDGHSCQLDDTGQIIARVGLANLLSDAVKAEIEGDHPVLGNSPPTTRRFQRRPDLRMVEAQHNDAWGAFAHLTTPLGYLGSWIDWPRVRAKIEEGVLIAGGSLDRPSAFIARSYPFTPEDIRPGVLRGRERIVTTRSGTYGWPSATDTLRTFRYDAAGTEHPGDWPINRNAGAVSVHVELAPNEAAIIERIQLR